MICAWLRKRRRRKLLATPFPESWHGFLEPYPFYAELDAGERGRLDALLRVLVAEKQWEGCGGFELTEEAKVVIAAQAALLVLEIEHDYYRRVTSILIYPTAVLAPMHQRYGGGIVTEDTAVSGVAWYRGPVILSWNDVVGGAMNEADGRNVTFHEFAHRLDMLDGFVDGTPKLPHRAAYAAWVKIMTEEFAQLQDAARRGRKSVLDRYGATNSAEFFAVATEAFFEKPRHLRRKHEGLYGCLRDYYRQDPAARRERSLSSR